MVEAGAVVIYKGRILNPLSYTELEDIPDGSLTVKERKIIKYGRFKERTEPNIVDFGDKVITPGLIDTHVHLPQYDVVAMDGYELLEWLTNISFQQKNNLNLQTLVEKRQQDSLLI